MENRAETQPTIEELKQQNTKLEQQDAELTARIKFYEEQFNLAQQKRFGTSNKTHPDQLDLFNEAEAETDPAKEEPLLETVTYKRKKQREGREAKLDGLRVETVEYRLPVEEQVCACSDGAQHEMSKEIRSELKVIPAEVKVVEQVRYVYGCRLCEREAFSTPIVTAPGPKPVQAGSLASPSMVAYIMSQKYVESMPLYRQEQQLARYGVELSRQTLANWMLHGANTWLSILYDRMKAYLLAQDIAYADETTFQVLQEPGRAAEISRTCGCTAQDPRAHSSSFTTINAPEQVSIRNVF